VIKRVPTKIRDALIALVWPQECHLCGRAVEAFADGVACDRCWSDPVVTISFFDKPVCSKCGLPLDRSILGQNCGRCDQAPFHSARSCGLYAGALKASVLFLKSHPHLCPRLKGIIIETFSANRAALSCDVVIPVPLHPVRERERGFNQSSLIAKVIASKFDMAFDLGSLRRIKHTEQHRAGMDQIDRARSMERAFAVARPRSIEKAAVLLVDDVFTTGSTVAAATETLLEAGAARVTVLTVTRAAGR
jgi:ComF family protein